MYNPHVVLLSETHISYKDRNLLRQLGYSVIVSSELNVSIRGVAILKHKQFKVEISKVSSDKSGKWAIAQIIIGGNKYTFCVLYGSNIDEPTVFYRINMELLEWEGERIVIGDFNCIMNYDFDTTRRGASQRMRKTRAAIKEIGRIHALKDAWRVIYPDVAGYTYYSATQTLLSHRHGLGIR